MARRIDVELTSERDDHTWTWRAAGARQPRGVLDGALLYPGAKVGDVVRAEAEFDVDGITVVAVTPPKEARKEAERIELLPPAREAEPVTTTLVPKGRGDRRRERDGRPPRLGDRDDRGARRPDRPGPPDRAERERRDRRDRPDRGDRPGGQPGDARPRPEGGERRDRPERRERPQRPDRPPGDRRPRPERPAAEAKPKPKRLRPGRTHRTAVLSELAPEQRPVAEQLLSGGIPAVRQALERQNEQLRSEGKPEVRADALLALAEELHPKLRAAEWRDRAEAALGEVEEIDLRDLRSVVVAADDAARDEESRALAAQLRDALSRRVDKEHADWQQELASTLAEGRVVRALRLSSRPPKAGSPLPPDLAGRLAEQASAALTADVAQDRWAAVLDAVAYSPVRRTVQPQGVPAEPGEELLGVVRKLADRVPEIAARFGVAAPARPSRPDRPGRPRSRPPAGRSPRPPAPPGPAGGAAAPPPPPTAEAPPPEPQPTAQEPEPAPIAAPDAAADPAPPPEPEPQPTAQEPEPAPTTAPAADAAPPPEPAPDAGADAAPPPEPEPAPTAAQAPEPEAPTAPPAPADRGESHANGSGEAVDLDGADAAAESRS